MTQFSLDAVDREIIYLLQENARRSITDIADAVGVADNTVRNRIDRLEAEGVIEGYGVDVNYERAGIQHHYLFICTAPLDSREQLAVDAGRLSGVVDVTTVMTGSQNVLITAAKVGRRDITQLAYDLHGLGLHIDREHLVWDQHRYPLDAFDPRNQR
ncbi:AsnC family transcriptional regulator [Halostella sp. JP-L12]|uniref:Lrp/AsnC family transcriptional regulator n=1 Tax=Halostella TaxID=1843185 RepID=UPI000EF824CA|nr:MULTISPECIES: AsnC family transcriptional regulator [Halostella]NHN46423.1 AsnC family transcriptional regulator [Halostella sp. JP-L12]